MTLRIDPAATTWTEGDWFVTSLEDLGIEEATAWEDVDLDELPWSPVRPTMGPLAGSETSLADTDGFDIDHDFIASWEARTEPDDRHAQEWLLAQRNRLREEQLARDAVPLPGQLAIRATWTQVQVGFGGPWLKVATCTICQSIVRRDQYAQHWLRCKDDVAVEWTA